MKLRLITLGSCGWLNYPQLKKKNRLHSWIQDTVPNVFSVKLKLLGGRLLHRQLYLLHHLMEEAIWTWIKTNFGTGASLKTRRLQKDQQELFFGKKSEGLNFTTLNNWCSDFLSLLTFFWKTIAVNFLDFLKSSCPKGCPYTKNNFDLSIHVLATDPSSIRWCSR